MGWDYRGMKFFDENKNEITFEEAIDKVAGHFPKKVIEGIFRYYSEFRYTDKLILNDDTIFEINNDFEYALDWDNARLMSEYWGINTWNEDDDEETIKEKLVEIGWGDLASEFSIDCDYWLIQRT